MVKVRFAPSPTGTLHVGGVRTALFNYFFAKATGGLFLLRIEDTDQARIVKGAVEQIQESLSWLGVQWDEMVIQSERLDYYTKYAKDLVSNGKARVEDSAIRFLTPKTGTTIWTDAIGSKEISFQNSDVEDFIILKKDGFPTYHLANVVDDHFMDITYVIRGEDWIPSCPKHILLYEAFGWKPPIFAHVPNILDTTGKKLSKRRGAKSVLDFKKEGFLADALLNYLMLLGWSPKDDREILTRSEIEKEFTLDNVNSAPAVFDERKLLWMNGEYIRQLTIDKLQLTLLEFDPKLSSIPHFDKYLPLAQTRMKTLADFSELVTRDISLILSDKQKEMARMLLEKFTLIEWNRDAILKACFEVRDELALTTKDLYIVLTTRPQGLPLAEKLEIETKDVTLQNLKKYL